MLSGRYQIMWSHSQVMWFLAPGYSQLIWSQKPDVIGSCDLCYRAATGRPKGPDIQSRLAFRVGHPQHHRADKRLRLKGVAGMSDLDLYDTDILAWSERQADLLRRHAAGDLVNDAELDWLNIA